ncbi:MAG TPA: hypothetical protein VK191_17030 [Symbiobacteriaceae bacterium]|nr:hypothetical protein [Symbiobacteriaceae bacterium]
MDWFWLVPVGALALTALLQDLKAYSVVVTAVGLLYALRQGRRRITEESASGAPQEIPRRLEPILLALLPQFLLFLLGKSLLGGRFPGADHDAVQAGDKAYLSALLLGGQSLLSLLVAARWPVQRIVARLTLLAGLALLLTLGVLGHGRWANDWPRLGGSLALFGLAILVELWLSGEEPPFGEKGEPDLAGLSPAVAAALGPAALFLEAHHLWQGVAVADLAREGRFLLVATGSGWMVWAGLLALLGAHPRLRSLRPMAVYTAGATVLYGVCWVLIG